jgi:hypothetical protein
LKSEESVETPKTQHPVYSFLKVSKAAINIDPSKSLDSSIKSDVTSETNVSEEGLKRKEHTSSHQSASPRKKQRQGSIERKGSIESKDTSSARMKHNSGHSDSPRASLQVDKDASSSFEVENSSQVITPKSKSWLQEGEPKHENEWFDLGKEIKDSAQKVKKSDPKLSNLYYAGSLLTYYTAVFFRIQKSDVFTTFKTTSEIRKYVLNSLDKDDQDIRALWYILF